MKTHTEQEAMTKWCPMTRVTSKGDGSDEIMWNKDKRYEECCMASNCMWWQPDGDKGYCGIVKK